jgi:hypothetical protein
MTQFIIEHQCPQCGAPAELDETDRLFECPFCRVTSYLTVPDFFRYILPHRAPAGQEIFYMPYWRLKGMLFSCTPKGIHNRFLDVSSQALRCSQFPFNIGFRGQTQKLRFAAVEKNSIYIKPDTAFHAVLKIWSKQYSYNLPKPIVHQDFIGETQSMIYAPFYMNNQVMDAVLNQPVSDAAVHEIPDNLLKADHPDWPLTFLPALCPQCGWDLKGSKDAMALDCGNCHTVWHAQNGRLKQLKTAHAVDGTAASAVYLPFWRIKADVGTIQLATYADLVEVANLPKVVQPGWDEIPFSFWSPGFKIHPQRYLNICTKLTLSPPVIHLAAGPPKGQRQPVNMPLQEAVESLKLTLADFLKPRARMVDQLPSIEIKPLSALLVYLPFEETAHEWVHADLRLAVGKRQLTHAKNL